MDVFSFFQFLSAFVGMYWAGLLVLVGVALGLIGLGYFKFVIPSGKVFEGEGANAEAQRTEYASWRHRLVHGGRVAQTYDDLLSLTLNRVDKMFGDEPASTRHRPATWTGEALDRCVLLALLYPVLSLLVIWHITGINGAAETALGMVAGTSDSQRAMSAGAIALVTLASIWFSIPPAGHETTMWRVIRVVTFVAAIAIAGTAAARVAGAVAIAVAGAVAVAVSVATGAAIGLSVSGRLELGASVLIAAAGAGGGASLVNWAIQRFEKARTILLLAFICLFLLIIPGVVALVTPSRFLTSRPEWALLALFGALPLVNAFFDWLSLGLTRFLLRKGQFKGGWWPIGFAMLDIVAAVCLLFAVLGASLVYLKLMNTVSITNGGKPVLDVTQIILDLRTNPGNPSLWWIYVTVFTTFLPSVVNLSLGGLSVLRGVPGFTRRIAKKWLPEDPALLTVRQRAIVSAALTSQWGIALFGATALMILLVVFSQDLLSQIGLGLVDFADWLDGLNIPGL
ncbi:MAG: hypothetical protein KDA53_11710 [Hyphomonas sp.]|nr:hypothetical protein [Hyphomonas sp.]